MTGQSKAKYKLHHLPIECLQCENAEFDQPKVRTFGYDYVDIHTVYRLKTPEICAYSPFLLVCKVLGKSEIWPKKTSYELV